MSLVSARRMDLGSWDLVLRLATATFAGGVIGLDREARAKPAGLRTHALVALGAALVTSTVAEMAGLPGGADAVSRAIQGIIAGVGFLGGGAILKGPGRDYVRGLTTAASIWFVASLGIACGAGFWRQAFVALAFGLAVLILGGPVETVIHRLSPAHKHDGAERDGERK